MNNQKNTTDSDERELRTQHTENHPVLALPPEMLVKICEYLDLNGLVNASCTCLRFYSLFHKKCQELSSSFLLLLQSVIDGDENKVKNMLNAKPSLLLLEPHITQRIESKKTWQIFRARKPFEVAVIRNQLKMIDLILPYFSQLKDGEDIASNQYTLAMITSKKQNMKHINFKALIDVIAQETFPNGFPNGSADARDSENFPYYTCNFDGKLSKNTEIALSAFRKKLLPDEMIILEEYYDIEAVLDAAYKAHNKHFHDLIDEERRILYRVCVIGFIQSLLVPELGEIFCENLLNVVEQQQPISERAANLELTNYPETTTISFYRKSRDARDLGFRYLIGCNGDQNIRVYPGFRMFSNLSSQRMVTKAKWTAELDRPTYLDALRPYCSIC